MNASQIIAIALLVFVALTAVLAFYAGPAIDEFFDTPIE